MMAEKSSMEGNAVIHENASPDVQPSPSTNVVSTEARIQSLHSESESIGPAEEGSDDPGNSDDFEAERQRDEEMPRRPLVFSNAKREAYDDLAPDVQRDVYSILHLASTGQTDLIELSGTSNLEAMKFLLDGDHVAAMNPKVLAQYLRPSAFSGVSYDLEWLRQQPGVNPTKIYDERSGKGKTAWEIALAVMNPDLPRSYGAVELFLLSEINHDVAPFDISWNTNGPVPTKRLKHEALPEGFWDPPASAIERYGVEVTSGWFTLAGNNLLWSIIVVYLRLTQQPTAINLAQVLKYMIRDFKQLKQPAPYLFLREPGFVVDFLKIPNDAAEMENEDNPNDSGDIYATLTPEEIAALEAIAADEEDAAIVVNVTANNGVTAEGDATADNDTTAEEEATVQGILEGEIEEKAEDFIGLPEPMSSEASYLSLSLPYFSLDTYDHLKARQSESEAFTKSFNHCIGGMNTRDTSMHLQLTLDEYCRPVLGSRLGEINRKQVFARYNKLKRDANDDSKMRANKVKRKIIEDDVPGDTRLITIRQAWLWKIDDNVFTAFADAHDDYLRKIFSDDAWKSPAPTPDELLMMTGKFLSYLIDMLENPLSEDAEPILNVFEDSINLLSDMVNRYVKTTSVEDLKMEREINFLHDIGDIREELSMIKLVLQQQEDVWKDFISNAFPDDWSDDRFKPTPYERRDEWRIIARPQQQFERYKRRIAQLEEDADRVKDSISTRLDLQSKHVSMQEAHSNAVLSTAVFGFTIITIIFTPLSFVISLLALPVHKYQNHQENGAYSQGYVVWNMFAGEIVTLFVTIVAMWAAVEFFLLKNVKERWTPWLEKHFPALFKTSDEKANGPMDETDNKVKGDVDKTNPTNEKAKKDGSLGTKRAKDSGVKRKGTEPASANAAKAGADSTTPRGDDIV